MVEIRFTREEIRKGSSIVSNLEKDYVIVCDSEGYWIASRWTVNTSTDDIVYGPDYLANCEVELCRLCLYEE
jgi:hypothetical protein